jgi:uncharacterized glyoxalase superfamily protein PhnB
MWSHITAQLNVPDLEAALAWYRDVLACKIAWRSEDGSYGAVYNGTTELFFSQTTESTAGTVLCVRVTDVDAVYKICLDNDAPIVSEPGDKPWAMREFEVVDPYGHRLRIGESSLH